MWKNYILEKKSFPPEKFILQNCDNHDRRIEEIISLTGITFLDIEIAGWAFSETEIYIDDAGNEIDLDDFFTEERDFNFTRKADRNFELNCVFKLYHTDYDKILDYIKKNGKNLFDYLKNTIHYQHHASFEEFKDLIENNKKNKWISVGVALYLSDGDVFKII